MPPLRCLLEKSLVEKLRLMTPSITTVQSLLSCDTFQLAKNLECTLAESQAIKLRISEQILADQLTEVPTTAYNLDRLSLKQRHRSLLTRLPPAVPPVLATVQQIQTIPSVPLGIETLDCTLFPQQGVPAGSLVEMVGGSGAGKTYVALTASIANAVSGRRVLLITTCNDVLTLKHVQMMTQRAVWMQMQRQKHHEHPPPLSQQEEQQQLMERSLAAMDRLSIHPCYDLWQLFDILTNVKNGHKVGSPHCKSAGWQSHSPSTTPSQQEKEQEQKLLETAPDSIFYDVVVIDCLHHLIAPLTTTATVTSVTTTATTTTSSSSSSNKRAKVLTPPEYLASLLQQLGILLRSIAAFQRRNSNSTTSDQRQQNQVQGLSKENSRPQNMSSDITTYATATAATAANDSISIRPCTVIISNVVDSNQVAVLLGKSIRRHSTTSNGSHSSHNSNNNNNNNTVATGASKFVPLIGGINSSGAGSNRYARSTSSSSGSSGSFGNMGCGFVDIVDIVIVLQQHQIDNNNHIRSIANHRSGGKLMSVADNNNNNNSSSSSGGDGVWIQATVIQRPSYMRQHARQIEFRIPG